jgi:siroheme synthase
MITHSPKKIHIIGSNPNDFFDLTIEAVDILSKSNLIIYSKKFDLQYGRVFEKSNKKFFFEEDLAKSKTMLLKVIHKLFETYNSISHLIIGDPFLFFENNEESYFQKKKIPVEKVLGIPEIILWMNKKKLFLTNRNKNSSVSFFYPKTKNDCNKLLKIGNFEKLIIKVSTQSVLEDIRKIVLKKLNKNLRYKVFADAKELKLDSTLKLDKSISNVYIILENAKL